MDCRLAWLIVGNSREAYPPVISGIPYALYVMNAATTGLVANRCIENDKGPTYSGRRMIAACIECVSHFMYHGS